MRRSFTCADTFQKKHKVKCMGAKLNMVTDWLFLVPRKSTKYLDASEHIGSDAWTTEQLVIPMNRALYMPPELK